MFRWWLKWTFCLFWLITTSKASPDDTAGDFGGGESGSGMLQAGKSAGTPVEPPNGRSKTPEQSKRSTEAFLASFRFTHLLSWWKPS